ncbi:MAG TPA: TetR/AcrR family transcriptional regulator [Streptosporangiaceae bacterium]|nr:TetR/AcrR family transcriptional regulator [Streptosporangiaceae bacterium]
MSTPYEASGRTRQKRRTREALITAARDLIAAGKDPAVEDAAAAAGISRTTAYRYFPTQRALLVAAHPEIDTPSLLPSDAPGDPAARLDAVIDAFTRLIADTESQQRTMLRLSLDPSADRKSLPLRKGRAVGWIGEALSPLRGQLTAPELERLVLAIRSATGIEARVWLTDVAGLTGQQATDLQQWTARAIYRSALHESGQQRQS